MCGGNRIHLCRQSFILLTIVLQSISTGVMLGFPSVLNPAILDPHGEIRVTSSQASWLSSSLGIAGILGFMIISPILQVYGRKAAHMMKNLFVAIGWILFYFAGSVAELFAARIVQGFAMGGVYVNVLIIGEYVHPQRRGYFITIQKFCLSTGTLLCHSIALSLSWRQIAGLFFIPAILSVILTLFWKESPYFLALKGRYDECKKSYHWLNGTKSNRELQNLILTQRKRRQINVEDERIKKFFKKFIRRDFQRSFLIVAILTIVIDLSGRNYFKAYIVDIMTELIGDKSIAMYCSIGGDTLTLVALLISCFTVRYFSRKRLLMSFGFVTVLLMFTLSLLIFFKSNVSLLGLPWLTPTLVLLLNFIVHIGVSPVSFVIIGEIFPLDVKGIGVLTSGITFTVSFSFVLKLTPVLMENLGLGGVYLIYGSGLLVCFSILFFILPETKDKTLLEIEEAIQKDQGLFDKNDALLESFNNYDIALDKATLNATRNSKLT